MNVGILGSGMVGKALAIGFNETGHNVMIGSRDPEKLKDFCKENNGISSGTFPEVSEHGELIVLAVTGEHFKSCIEEAKKENFDDKLVIDVMNPLERNDNGMELFISYPESLGKMVQEHLPNSNVVKAWNIISAGNMYKPKFEDQCPTMFICGNDLDSKDLVHQILNDFGWEDVVDIGSIEKAYMLETLTMLWLEYMNQSQDYVHAFALLRK